MSESDPTQQPAAETADQDTAAEGAASGVEVKASKLLEEAEAALDQLDAPEASAGAPRPFVLEEIVGEEGPPEKCSIDLLRDVDLNLRIELGRTHMLLEDVLKLRRGSVVTLDKLAGDPVDLYVNGRLVARGEVLVLNDNFCVRVGELIGSDSLLDDK
ncbi:MAG: flagellar motor switch protein FliN [Planctomycetota bacterium]|nr:MAG: flagellar motor switch protein FliN [Planctomycetota bacterium]